MNINEKTGIRYGIISANALHGDVIHDLMCGKDITYENALKDFIDSSNYESDDEMMELIEDFNDSYYPDEPHIEGEINGVKYVTCWLGGALNFFILESPHVVKANLCSPCVPNAGNLDDLDPEGYDTYGVPKDWLWNEEV